nr:cysteine-rich CWC family protein [Leptospira ainlahdjerensis]
MAGKPCPRCGIRFECGAEAQSCACFSVNLSSRAKEFIEKKYQDCLCVSCLLELSSQKSD